MGRLFWKIFLAFWVAMLLIAAGVAVATAQLERARQLRVQDRWEQSSSWALQAEQALEHGGPTGLETWLRGKIESEGSFIYVLDGEREILGRRPPRPGDRPPPGRDGRGGRDGPRPPPRDGRRPPDGHRGEDSPRHGSTVVQLFGGPRSRYRLVVDLEPRTGDLFRRPSTAVVWIALAAPISGAVCFLLARYLIAPIRSLQRVTRRFTAGDLQARVGASMGSRRDEIADLGHDFDAMAERIGRMLTSKHRLLRDLSHELRSPLARLQVALELARKRADGRADNELERIELESERLNGLIGEILTLARLEASPEILDRARFDLVEMLRGIVHDARFEAEASNKSVRLVAIGPVQLDGNDELLHRAIENVVRNAVRHTRANTEVEVSLELEGDATLLAIHDHGAGVPETSLPHLFEPFYRDPDTRAEHPVGHGIGLAIAKRAIDLHGGRIVARNHPQGGLVVEIRLSRSG